MLVTRAALGCARRRGAIIILVAVCMIVLLGFAALTVDVGLMYNARADLQRAADSAALAAAAALSDYELDDPIASARDEAESFVRRNYVLGKSVTVDLDDVTFLRSHLVEGQYQFNPTALLPDAVRVQVRLAEDSPNGPLGLFFAGVFGRTHTSVSASATAGMIPRDVALVADLSASHTDDSELRHYRSTTINMHDVWAALPGGWGDIDSTWGPDDPLPDNDLRQAAGPAWGFMKRPGFGTLVVNSQYIPTTDPGLVYLPYRQNWTNAGLSTYLAEQKYSAQEIAAIMQSGSTDSTTSYPIRVAVALGLASWNSGLPGGRWLQLNLAPGDANTSINGSELEWTEPLLGRTPQESKGIWQEWIRNYVMSTRTTMYQANSAFQYRYGIKTFLNFLLEQRPEPGETVELAGVPTQPMQAVKDGITHMMSILTDMDAQDQVSLEGYSTIGRHEVDLTSDFSRVAERLSEMQAAYYGHYTNIGAGLERAIEELSSPRARTFSKKVIILYTDGIANIDRNGNYNLAQARQYAWDMATEAARRGFRIYAVSVGAEPDLAFMDRIAELGDGQHYHAEGSIEQYSRQLDYILNVLSAKRAVQLIE